MPASYKFSSLPNINIPRTAMKVECTHPTSFQHGKIIPLFCVPVGPAENYKLYLNSLIRMGNPIFPFYGDVKVFVHSFFVPMRLVWEHTAEFFGENVLSKGPQPIDYKIPSAEYGATGKTASVEDYVYFDSNDNLKIANTPNTANTHNLMAGIESVSHYLGKPIPVVDYIDDYAGAKIPVSVLKERGFWMIYNEYYRPQQLIDPIYVDKGDTGRIGADPNRKVGSVATEITFATEVPTCTKMYDYFRSCTTSPIYSDEPVTVPLTDAVAPLIVDETITYDVEGLFGTPNSYLAFGTNGSQADVSFGNLGGDNFLNTFTNPDNVEGGYLGVNIDEDEPGADDFVGPFQTNLKTDLRNVQISVDVMRRMFAEYNFLYRDNFGTRFPEIIQTHFNLKPSIAILQRPELLHEGSFPINISQVLSTAGASDDTTTKLGQPGANSVTANRQLVVNKSIEEWGFIYIMLETKHKRIYSGGINAYDLRQTKFDFYFPEFAQIGNKKVMTTELSIDIPVETNKAYDSAFGYQEAWAEERYFTNRVSGLLDPRAPSSLSYMTLAEDADPYASVIDKDFVLEDRGAISKVLVTGSNGPDYTGDFALTGVMAKPMPLYSEPGLIDHIGAW